MDIQTKATQALLSLTEPLKTVQAKELNDDQTKQIDMLCELIDYCDSVGRYAQVVEYSDLLKDYVNRVAI